jgi:hypothetical protein
MKQELSPVKAAGLIGLAIVVLGGALYWFMGTEAGQGHPPETEMIKPEEARQRYDQYNGGPGGGPGGTGAEAEARARGVPPPGG